MTDTTSPFRYVENLTVRTFRGDVAPWDFKPTETITEQIRHDKTARQDWYKNVATKHCFYGLVEPSNPNMRPSVEDNPPRLLHGIVADYDMPIPQDRIDEAVCKMPHTPTWTEKSLGGNWRLVWLFEEPMHVDTWDFCALILTESKKWLGMDLLPGLDEPALNEPTRLYCLGSDWKQTGPAIPRVKTQGFFVSCGKKFTFKPADRVDIPLSEIEQELTKRFNLSWPGEFAVGSQGPSFWVEGSESPMSAIVKADGMFTFSAHASKPFSSWKDILGAEWCAKWETDTMSIATGGCFWDGTKFWRKLPTGLYASEDKADFGSYLHLSCKLSSKDKTGEGSPASKAMQHIRDFRRINGAAPMLFRPKGEVIEFNGMQFLNIAQDNIIKPAPGTSTWGAKGQFPFISSILGKIFDPVDPQLDIFLSWWARFYQGALAGKPLPGQNIFLAGGVGIGKTLLNRHIIGATMGGGIDASNYVRGDAFGGHMFLYPVWCLDDETIIDDEKSRTQFAAFVKKLAANQEFCYHQKFERPVQIEWMGRFICTLNLDFISCRALPPMDNSSSEKISVFRCSELPPIHYPDRYEIQQILAREMPHLCRFLADFAVPDKARSSESRYGVRAYAEPTLVERAQQTNQVAPFRELLIVALKQLFSDSPTLKGYEGSATQIHHMLLSNPMNVEVMRALRINMISRFLETMERSGDLGISSSTDSFHVRQWRFPRL